MCVRAGRGRKYRVSDMANVREAPKSLPFDFIYEMKNVRKMEKVAGYSYATSSYVQEKKHSFTFFD